MIDKKRNLTEKVALLKTYIIQFIYPKGNGWAFVNATSVSQAQSVFYNQTKYEDTKITGIKETKWYGNNMQLVYEGAVTTSTILNVNVTLKDLIDSTGAFESVEEYIRFILEQFSYTKEEIDEKFKNLNIDIDLSNYYTKEEIGKIIKELPTSEGTQGKDGITPHIGDNGNWYIGDEDTGKPSRGETGPKGEDGTDGKNGTNGTNGVNGSTPYIGINGNWFIDGIDTKKPSQGNSPYIGSNGNWWVGNKDLDVPATSGATALNNSAIRRITNTDLTTYGISKDYIERATSGENAGHYSYEQYNQMRLNAEQMTKLIKDTYDAGYSGILFPRGHYCFCSLAVPNSRSDTDLIWILNISHFTVDFNGSTLELLHDSNCDWDLSGIKMTTYSGNTYVDVGTLDSLSNFTQCLNAMQESTVNNKNIKKYTVSGNCERLAKNSSNQNVGAYSIYNTAATLYKYQGDIYIRRVYRDNENKWEDTSILVYGSNQQIDYAATYENFKAAYKEALGRYCSASIIVVRQSNNVTIQNGTLKGDCYTTTYSNDITIPLKRVYQLCTERSTGVVCSGAFVSYIYIKNLDVSGFTADGISTGERSLYIYYKPTTYDVRKQALTNTSVTNSYVTSVGHVRVELLKRYDKFYIVDNNPNLDIKDIYQRKYRVKLEDSTKDKKERALSVQVYSLPTLTQGLLQNVGDVVTKAYNNHIYTIFSPGRDTRRIKCYPRFEMVLYKSLTVDEVIRMANITVTPSQGANVTDADKIRDVQTWFSSGSYSFDAPTGQNITLYHKVATDANGIMIPIEYFKDSGNSVKYLQPTRVIDAEFKEDIRLYPQEKYFRIQCFYVPIKEDNTYKPTYVPHDKDINDYIIDIYYQATNHIYIDCCNIHDNLRGNLALGSNDTYILNSVLDKYTSKSLWVPMEAGGIPRYSGSTDYMIDMEDVVSNNVTIANCVLRGLPGTTSILGSQVLRFNFYNNRCYVSSPNCDGIYSERIVNNVFYDLPVFDLGNGREPMNIRNFSTRPVYRNSVYENNVYYNSYLRKLNEINKYHTIKVVNCTAELNEVNPDTGVMLFNTNHTDTLGLLTEGYDTNDCVFDNCSFVASDNTAPFCYMDKVNNTKLTKGDVWYVRELDNVELDNTRVEFLPTSKNVKLVGDTAYITINANKVRNLTTECKIYEGFYLKDMIGALKYGDNQSCTKCVLNFNFTNCTVELKNTMFSKGIVHGKYLDDYYKCVIAINYNFSNCTFVASKNLPQVISDSEKPIFYCTPILGTNDYCKINLNFTNCDLTQAIRLTSDNKKCLARKMFYSDNNSDGYNSVYLTRCNIPNNLYLDVASNTTLKNKEDLLTEATQMLDDRITQLERH